MSDAETQSGNEHEPSDNVNDNVHVDAQPSNDNDIEIEPAVDLVRNVEVRKREILTLASSLSTVSHL